MIKLQKQFTEFNNNIQIGDLADDLREKRDKLKSDIEESLPEECEKYGIEISKSDLRFINQGSYKIGTTIKSPGSVDIDYAVIIPVDIDEHDNPVEIKKSVKKSLEIANKRVPKIKEPCVTVGYHRYGEEFMHIDFPIYAEYNGFLYLGRGKEFSINPHWELADPEGLNEYFLDAFSGKPQLKRIVRYFKQWKQEKYGNSTNSNEVPPSVALTILACEHYQQFTDEGDDDLSSLYYTAKGILDSFSVSKDIYGEITSASISCYLPVQPYSDVLYKMRKSSSHMILFYKRLSSAVSNLREAVNISEEHEAAKYIQKVLGSVFEIPEKNAAAAVPANKKEYSFG